MGLEKHIHRIFVAGAILGALSCFARADYNLPLYSFLYIMWDQDVVSSHLISKLTPTGTIILNSMFTLSLGWEGQATHIADSNMVRWYPVDGILDPPLELRWNEGLAEGSSQRCDLLLCYQLLDEDRHHIHGWLQLERQHQEANVTDAELEERRGCRVVRRSVISITHSFWIYTY